MGNAGYGNHTESPGDPKQTSEPTETPKPKPASGREGSKAPAGPHADPSLVNDDATPGAGALTPAGKHDDMDSTSG